MAERICWIFLALIHMPPAIALFAPSMLERLYGLDSNGSAFVLVHHRAALFLGVAVACVWAFFDPGARGLACLVVAISMVSFLVLYWNAGASTNLRSIAIADLVGLLPLGYVVWLNSLRMTPV